MKNSVLPVMVFVLIGLSLAGCNKDKKTDSITSEEISGKVVMWTFLDPQAGTDVRSKVLASIIADFESKNQNVEVVTEPQAYDLLASKFLAGHYAGNAPDIIWTIPINVPAVVSANGLEPLENVFLKDLPREEVEDLANSVFNYCSQPDKHFIVGITSNATMIFYRKDLFEKFGIKAPFETWEELIAACKKLQGYVDPANGQVMDAFGMGLSSMNTDGVVLHSYLAALQNGKIFNDDGTANWNNANGLRALGFQKSLVYEHKIVPPTCLSYTVEDANQGMSSGKFAMIITQNARMSQIRNAITVAKPTDIEAMLFPKTDGKASPSIVGGWSLGIWSGSKNKKAAGALIQAMVSKEADLKWVKEALQAPIRKSTLVNNKDFFDQPENSFLKVCVDAITNGLIPESKAGTNTTRWVDDLNKAMENACIGNMTDQQALDQAVKDFNERNVK
jgi:ABC-type glycerol-3-phosphate transport system substrate-binding protein